MSLPSILILFDSEFEILTGFIALRSLRIFKTLRIIEYIPGGKKITKKIRIDLIKKWHPEAFFTPTCVDTQKGDVAHVKVLDWHRYQNLQKDRYFL